MLPIIRPLTSSRSIRLHGVLINYKDATRSSHMKVPMAPQSRALFLSRFDFMGDDWKTASVIWVLRIPSHALRPYECGVFRIRRITIPLLADVTFSCPGLLSRARHAFSVCPTLTGIDIYFDSEDGVTAESKHLLRNRVSLRWYIPHDRQAYRKDRLKTRSSRSSIVYISGVTVI